MKRALTAAVFGGLLVILVPNVALGGTTRPVAPYDHNAEHKDGACAGQTEGAADSEQAPPRAGDREQHGSDGGESLF